MSYTPFEWKTGDTVTAERLNAIEQGVAGGELPAVTPADENKVLRVNDEGEWIASTIGIEADPDTGDYIIVFDAE